MASYKNVSILTRSFTATSNPIRYPIIMSKRRVHMMTILIWLCSSLISFPAIAWWRLTDLGPGPALQATPSRPPPTHSQAHVNTSANAEQQTSANTNTSYACELTLSGAAAENQSELFEVYVTTARRPERSTSAGASAASPDMDASELCRFTSDAYYQLVGSAISFYMPTSIMFYLYYRIYRTARSVKLNLESGERLCSSYRPRASTANATFNENPTEGEKENSSSAGCVNVKDGSGEQQGNRGHSSTHVPQLALRVHRGGVNSLKSHSFRAQKPVASRLTSPQPLTPISILSPTTSTPPPQLPTDDGCTQEQMDSRRFFRGASPISIGQPVKCSSDLSPVSKCVSPAALTTTLELGSNIIRLELCTPDKSDDSPHPILDVSGSSSMNMNASEQLLETPPNAQRGSTPSPMSVCSQRHLSLSYQCTGPDRRTMDTSTSTALSGDTITSTESLSCQTPNPGQGFATGAGANSGSSFGLGPFASTQEACTVTANTGTSRSDRKSIVSMSIAANGPREAVADNSSQSQQQTPSSGRSRSFIPILRKLTALRDELRRLTRDQKAAKTLGTYASLQ